MLSLTHTLISLPTAIYFDNLVIIFLTAFLLHFLADSFLHWNFYPEQTGHYFHLAAATDVTIGLLLAWLLTKEGFFSLPVLTAIAGGNTPDIVHGLWNILPKKYQIKLPSFIKPWLAFHDKIQNETSSPKRGLFWQIIFIAASLFFLFYPGSS